MKRMLSVAVAVAMVAGLAGVALAHGPGWGAGYGWGHGPGMMGGGWGMGPGMMGGARGGPGWGPGDCPYAYGAPAATPPEPITEGKAKALAEEYAAKYLKGFTVERVLPFTGRFRTMYQVELKGPKGETRYLHVNPWGGVMPFGGPLSLRSE